LAFSFRHVLKCEYSGLFPVVVPFAVLVGLSRLFEEPRARLEALVDIGRLWRVVFVLGANILIGLHTLKKNTHILDITSQ
jgi:hypothetical protein